MPTEKRKPIHLVYSIALSAVTILAGLCLMAACVNIYHSGSFSREAVAAHFSPIAAPVYLCLALVIGGFVLDLLLPLAPGKRLPVRQHSAIAARLRAVTDLSGCDESLLAQLHRLERSRLLHRRIGLALMVLGSGIFLIYALNGANFSQKDINGSMIRAMWVLLPCMAVPFGYNLFAAYHSTKCIQAEAAILRSIGSPKAEAGAVKASGGILVTRCCLLALSFGLLLYGLLAGGTADVLTKAVNICTECIGLG